MKISIIGGKGFIGRNLVDCILKNTKNRVDIELIDVDIKYFHPETSARHIDMVSKGAADKIFSNNPPDIVINLIGYEGNKSYYDSLVSGPLINSGLCDAMSSFGFKGRFIYLSSSNVGKQDINGSAYTISEDILKTCSERLGFRLSIIRVPGVYGKRVDPNGDMVNNIIESMLLGLDTVTMSKDCKINLLHVDDLVNFIVFLLKSKDVVFCDTYQMSGSIITTEKLVNAIQKSVGYGKCGFSNIKPFFVKTSDKKVRDVYKYTKTRFNKKLIDGLVDNRKKLLIKKGYKEV